MRVCVVGGGGYIGSRLVPELIKRHHEVFVIDLFWFGNHLPETVKFWGQDAADLTIENLSYYDAVIFLGGLSNDPMADFDPIANYYYNAALPSYLAYIAQKAGVKVFIHGGSCSVYGLLEPDTRASEALPARAQTPYGVSKLMAEFGVMRQNGNKMRVVNFRMGTVCGPSPRMRFDLVINAMVKDSILSGVIKVNDQNAERPILDIGDAVSAYAQALTNEDVRGIYNLFSYNTNILTLATEIACTMSNFTPRKVMIDLKNEHDNRSYTASPAKANEVGIYCFTPRSHTIDSVRKYVQSLSKDQLEDPQCYNIQTFKTLNIKSDCRPALSPSPAG